MNSSPYESNLRVSEAESVHTFLQRVYLWMTGGLGITALVGALVSASPQISSILMSGMIPFIVLAIATFGIVLFLTARIHTLSVGTASMLFLVYSALNGLLFAPLFLIYTDASLGVTFLCTAGTFGAMTVYAFTTKRDLSGMGRFFMMAVIGLVISLPVNMFFKSNTFDLIISGVGVLIFSGLTAYDTQRLIKDRDFMGMGSGRTAILGALTLYLDFINLFLYLLSFLGKRD
ncbi:MAG: Bax inhibitor-1/YccA family protein [Akkermansia sp.]